TTWPAAGLFGGRIRRPIRFVEGTGALEQHRRLWVVTPPEQRVEELFRRDEAKLLDLVPRREVIVKSDAAPIERLMLQAPNVIFDPLHSDSLHRVHRRARLFEKFAG